MGQSQERKVHLTANDISTIATIIGILTRDDASDQTRSSQTTLRQLLTKIKDRDETNRRQGAVYEIKCCDCQATYIGETGRNLIKRTTD